METGGVHDPYVVYCAVFAILEKIPTKKCMEKRSDPANWKLIFNFAYPSMQTLIHSVPSNAATAVKGLFRRNNENPKQKI